MITDPANLLGVLDGDAGTWIVRRRGRAVGRRARAGGGMSWLVRVIANRYADSVRLMSAARDVRGMDDVEACEIGIGTPANVETLAGARRAGRRHARPTS